jgi:hypothetical protein
VSAGAGQATAAAPRPSVAVKPVPTDEEMAAIVAAVEVLWPRPAGASVAIDPAPRWRFSGRWWTKPVPSRRDRPR